MTKSRNKNLRRPLALVKRKRGETSIFWGVSINKNSKQKPWQAHYHNYKNGTWVYVGTFKTQIEAALAHDAAIIAAGLSERSRLNRNDPELRELLQSTTKIAPHRKKPKTSIFWGVCKSKKYWRAAYTHEKKVHFIGMFKLEEAAARAYDAAIIAAGISFAHHLNKDYPELSKLLYPDAATSTVTGGRTIADIVTISPYELVSSDVTFIDDGQLDDSYNKRSRIDITAPAETASTVSASSSSVSDTPSTPASSDSHGGTQAADTSADPTASSIFGEPVSQTAAVSEENKQPDLADLDFILGPLSPEQLMLFRDISCNSRASNGNSRDRNRSRSSTPHSLPRAGIAS